MVHIPRLGDKLLVFYGAAKDIKSDAQFAQALGRAKSTITGWIKGTDATPPDTIPDQNLANITEILNAQLGMSLSVAEAQALWAGTLPAFMRRLAQSVPNPLDKVLEGNSQRLGVRYTPLWHDKLGVVEDAIDVPAAAVGFCAKDAVTFEIDGRTDCGLVVLSQDREGWRGLCPGTFHGGVIASIPEKFPASARPIRFQSPLGYQRLVFIEHPGGLQPNLPSFKGASALHHSDFVPFTEQLAEPPWAGKWRWFQVEFWVTETGRLEHGGPAHT